MVADEIIARADGPNGLKAKSDKDKGDNGSGSGEMFSFFASTVLDF